MTTKSYVKVSVPLTQFLGNKKYLDVIRLVSLILLAVIIVTTIGARVESMGWILFSDLEKGNPIAVNALNQSFVCIAFFAVALISCIVSNFFKTVKEVE